MNNDTQQDPCAYKVPSKTTFYDPKGGGGSYLKFSTSLSGSPLASTSSVGNQKGLPSGVITTGCMNMNRCVDA